MPVIPPASVIAAHRLAFGPGVGTEDLTDASFPAWLDAQLSPDDVADKPCQDRIAVARLHIKYNAGEEEGTKWPAVDEQRPLSSLNRPVRELWHLTNWGKKMNYAERIRPFHEVVVATWLRAVYSRFQLREVLVDFWHNHFNVNAESDIACGVSFPTYDRHVIRKHCLGNFRVFLEAVATSTAMLQYLNNASSKASPANENFARELFELHTLGGQAYLNHLYNRWRDVPGALEGKPQGYVDQDVYEAARAFTGWTFASGQWARDGEHLASTGEFLYFEPWHDNYQKRILATEFDPNQPPMSDGRKVLDLVANHPATARHVCTKLCRRLVSDEPAESLVARAIEAWTTHRDAPDQIARVVRVIATSPEFASTRGMKVKRPFEFIAGLLRGTNADFSPDWHFLWAVGNTNHKLFNWPTPTGHPDDRAYWLGASTMLDRFRFPHILTQGWWKSARLSLLRNTPSELKTPRQLAEHWTRKLLGYLPPEPSRSILLNFAAKGLDPDSPLSASDHELIDHLNQLVSLIAMSPEYHER
jgi:uncharacterized protein (DUF1800 family)